MYGDFKISAGDIILPAKEYVDYKNKWFINMVNSKHMFMVLTLQGSGLNRMLMVPVSSQIRRLSNYSYSVFLSEWKRAGLHKPSKVNLGMRILLDRFDVYRIVGTVSKSDLKHVLDIYRVESSRLPNIVNPYVSDSKEEEVKEKEMVYG